LRNVSFASFLFSQDKNLQKITLKKITTTAYNMKGCFRFVYFHILNITKFGWLNIRMDDCHLHNHPTCTTPQKLGKGGGKRTLD
jgi:hypothetical protein